MSVAVRGSSDNRAAAAPAAPVRSKSTVLERGAHFVDSEQSEAMGAMEA